MFWRRPFWFMYKQISVMQMTVFSSQDSQWIFLFKCVMVFFLYGSFTVLLMHNHSEPMNHALTSCMPWQTVVSKLCLHI